MIRATVFRWATLSLLLLAPLPAFADSDDHEEARRALEAGEALPLWEILERARPWIRGDLIETEFEREDGRWVYEFKFVGEGGRVTEVYVDAATGKLLKLEADDHDREYDDEDDHDDRDRDREVGE